MFERLTEQGRYALAAALHEARAVGQSYIGTEHLLIGCARAGLGVLPPVDELRREIEPGDGFSGRLDFSPRARKALEATFGPATELGQVWVGPANLLHVLLGQPDSGACRVLERRGVDPTALAASLDLEHPELATTIDRIIDTGRLHP